MNVSKDNDSSSGPVDPSVMPLRTIIGMALSIIAMGIVLLYPDHVLPIRLGAFFVLICGVVLIVKQYGRLHKQYFRGSRTKAELGNNRELTKPGIRVVK